VAVGLGAVSVAAPATIPGTLTSADHLPMPAGGGSDDLLRFLLARREPARQTDWRLRLAAARTPHATPNAPAQRQLPLRLLGGPPRSRAVPAQTSAEIPPQHPIQPLD
jgi:hypothetical protein